MRQSASLDVLHGIFGAKNFFVELQLHLDEREDRRNAVLTALADRKQLPLVLTNDVRMLGGDELLLLDALTCIREKVQLHAAGKRLLQNGERFLKSPRVRWRRCFRSAASGAKYRRNCGSLYVQFGCARLSFSAVSAAGWRNPEEFLRARWFSTLPRADSVPTKSALKISSNASWDLSKAGTLRLLFDRLGSDSVLQSRGILVQGRGSAANSAVCYALGITACDPLKMDLLFERFCRKNGASGRT